VGLGRNNTSEISLEIKNPEAWATFIEVRANTGALVVVKYAIEESVQLL